MCSFLTVERSRSTFPRGRPGSCGLDRVGSAVRPEKGFGFALGLDQVGIFFADNSICGSDRFGWRFTFTTPHRGCKWYTEASPLLLGSSIRAHDLRFHSTSGLLAAIPGFQTWAWIITLLSDHFFFTEFHTPCYNAHPHLTTHPGLFTLLGPHGLSPITRDHIK